MSRIKTLDNDTDNKVTLGDVAYEVKSRIANPSESGFERFIGLEHFDSGSLTIRRMGNTSDVTSSMKLFRKGDILFARRNAYLKRASLVNFDGVCSGDAFVLRQIPDMIVENFLPLILNTEKLWNYAISYASGSMSKRVKWRNLAKYEFHLPSIKEQRRISSILWAIEKSIGQVDSAIIKAQRFKKVLMHELFTKGIGHIYFKETKIGKRPRQWEVCRLGGALELCQYGLSIPMNYKGEYPIIRMNELADGYVIPLITKYVDLEEGDVKKFKLEKGDVLFNRTNSYEHVGRTGIFLLDGDYVFASYLIRLRTKLELLDPLFLAFYFVFFHNQLRRLATKSVSQANINATNLKNFRIVLPPLEEQKKISEIISNTNVNVGRLGNHKEVLVMLKKQLLNDLIK